MPELRLVDPRTLVPNPNNPRRVAAPKAMDDQLVASIQTIGLIEPPRVREIDGALVLTTGHRRARAAIAAGLETIHVVVCEPDETADPMRSLSENVVRAAMNGIDIWRAMKPMEDQGWNEQAIADALALPVRMIRRLKLLASLHPPMLDAMAAGSMPNEEQLRSIAAANRDEQAQVWKKYKPKKSHDVSWWQIASALGKRRIPFAAAKFGDDLARAYGVTWHTDLFAPADEDGRYTADVEGFLGAQREHMQNTLPERGTLLAVDQHGHYQLPKKAEHVHSKPGKTDHLGYYVDAQSGEIRSIAYRMPEPKTPAKAKASDSESAPDTSSNQTTATRPRPDVTQKGNAIIGDLRTDALHQALTAAPINDSTLIALLVLALAGRNVSVSSPAGLGGASRAAVAATITEGGVITADDDLVRVAARSMLTATLSCRDNITNSGPVARIAGDTIGADAFLPTMATDEFLACLSKTAIETVAKQENVRIEARAKDTRARIIEHFKTGRYVYPGAFHRLTAADLATENKTKPQYVWGHGEVTPTKPRAYDETGRSVNSKGSPPNAADYVASSEAMKNTLAHGDIPTANDDSDHYPPVAAE